TPELFERFVNPDLDPLVVDLDALTAGFELPFGLDGFGSADEVAPDADAGEGTNTDSGTGADEGATTDDPTDTGEGDATDGGATDDGAADGTDETDPGTDDGAGDVIQIRIPAIALTGSTVVEQFQNLIKIIPSKVSLLDPIITATLFGKELEYALPLSTVIDKIAGDLLPDFLEAADGAITLDLLALLPESVTDVLQWFMKDAEAEPLEIELDPIDFGALEDAALGALKSKLGMGDDTATGGGETDTGAEEEPDTSLEPDTTDSLPGVSPGDPQFGFTDWVVADIQTEADPGRDEIQRLTFTTTNKLDFSGDEPPTFTLTLDDVTTEPIEWLQIGVPQNEAQRLIFIHKPGAVGTEYTLRLIPIETEEGAEDQDSGAADDTADETAGDEVAADDTPTDDGTGDTDTGEGDADTAAEEEAPELVATLTFHGDPEQDAAAIQAVLDEWFGEGNATVTFNEDESNTSGGYRFSAGGLIFDIEFTGELEATDMGQIAASTVGQSSQGLMLVRSETTTDGTEGPTYEEQAELIQEALNIALEGEAVTVEFLGDDVYQIRFDGDDWTLSDQPLLRAGDLAEGLKARTGVIAQGRAAKGPSVELPLLDEESEGTFDLEIEVDGDVFTLSGVPRNLTANKLVTMIQEEAVNEDGDPFESLELELKVTIDTDADGTDFWVLSFSGDSIADVSIDEVRYLEVEPEAPAEEGEGTDTAEGGDGTDTTEGGDGTDTTAGGDGTDAVEPDPGSVDITAVTEGGANRSNESWLVTFGDNFGFTGFKLYLDKPNSPKTATWDYRSDNKNPSATAAQLREAFAKTLKNFLPGQTVTTADFTVTENSAYSGTTGRRFKVEAVGKLQGVPIDPLVMLAESKKFRFTQATQGSPGSNEVQRIALEGGSQGSLFTLSFDYGEQSLTTQEIAFDATPQDIEDAINMKLGKAGRVTVTADGDQAFTVSFGGALAAEDIGLMTAEVTDPPPPEPAPEPEPEPTPEPEPDPIAIPEIPVEEPPAPRAVAAGAIIARNDV
ncbi:MAG: hypothetical protein ACKO8O_19530, partial [Betaproteobacteria bacterium]